MTATRGIRALSLGAGCRLADRACAVPAGGREGMITTASRELSQSERACVFGADVATLGRFLLRTDNLGLNCVVISYYRFVFQGNVFYYGIYFDCTRCV